MKIFMVLMSLLALLGVLSGQSVDGPLPRFEVADVHKSPNPKNPYTLLSGGNLRGERYDLRKATMLDLIRIAYGVDAESIYGGPDWLELDRFDITAKAPSSTPPERIALMLQSLLTDRFKLALHRDTKPVPAFVLTADKDAMEKLHPAIAANNPGCQYHAQGASTYVMYSCHSMTMDAFAKQLRGLAWEYLRNSVIDSTGLEGAWDFDVKWNPRSQTVPEGAERITVFTALEKQLGLNLSMTSSPQPVLFIDRVNEKPADNPPRVAELLPDREVEFEVADVKPSDPKETQAFGVTPGGGLQAHAVTMKTLLSTAWDIDWDHVDELITGAPKWTDSARFDINAKAAEPINGPPLRGSGFIDDDLRLMLRNLLIDRFKMKVHVENRLLSAYTLVAAKPKLKKAQPSHRTTCKEASFTENDPRDLNPLNSRLIVCQNITMPQFAGELQRLTPGYLAYGVEDATGVSGAWDFTLSFSPVFADTNGAAGASNAADRGAPDPNGTVSLFEAINKQLGLKLETRKRMIPVVVIDHIEEKPSDN